MDAPLRLLFGLYYQGYILMQRFTSRLLSIQKLSHIVIRSSMQDSNLSLFMLTCSKLITTNLKRLSSLSDMIYTLGFVSIITSTIAFVIASSVVSTCFPVV